MTIVPAIRDFAALDGKSRIVSIDFESTGKRLHTAADVAKMPKGWRPPGAIIEIGFVELLRDSDGWRKGATYQSYVNPDGPVDPQSQKVHGIGYDKLKRAPRMADVANDVRTFLGDDQIVAHAYKNELEYLAYEFARLKITQWGETPYPEERFFCTQRAFAELVPMSPKSLDAVCDRLWIDRSDRFASHGALLDADLTADAFAIMRDVVQGRVTLDAIRERGEARA